MNKFITNKGISINRGMSEKTIFSKDFILVAIGQIISVFGNQILRYALPLYLLNQTGSSTLFGTILAISFVPMLLLFPIGGIIADRVNKRNIMVFLDFLTAGLIFIFFLLSGVLSIVPLMAVMMIILYEIQGVYQPAVKASVPVLVSNEHIMKANSVVDMINSIASMAGPVIGGILFSIFGLIPILIISIFCFFFSAVMEIFIHIPFKKKETDKNILAVGLNDLKESFYFLFSEQPVLWKISLIFSSSNLLLTSLILIGYPVLITQSMGFSVESANRLYGYTQGIIAIGAVFGGFLVGILSDKIKMRQSPLLLIGISVIALISGVALQFVSWQMGVYIVISVCGGLLLTLHTLFQIQMMSCLQRLTPNDLIGKVASVFMCVVMCTNPIGQVIYGFVFENIGKYNYIPFYAAGGLMILITILTRKIFYGIDEMILNKK